MQEQQLGCLPSRVGLNQFTHLGCVLVPFVCVGASVHRQVVSFHCSRSQMGDAGPYQLKGLVQMQCWGTQTQADSSSLSVGARIAEMPELLCPHTSQKAESLVIVGHVL